MDPQMAPLFDTRGPILEPSRAKGVFVSPGDPVPKMCRRAGAEDPERMWPIRRWVDTGSKGFPEIARVRTPRLTPFYRSSRERLTGIPTDPQSLSRTSLSFLPSVSSL
ncbi:hypothetical protein MTO96_037346 [Rhipicephalus appendiculatus]